MNKYINIEKIKFTNRPESIPYFYRLSYRASITCLVLRLNCRKNSSCSLTKLHLIITSMYNDVESEHLIEKLNKNKLTEITLKFDPTVNNTIDFLLADKILRLTNNNQFSLTESGNEFVDIILENSELLTKEKVFLKKISTKLTEAKIKQISNLFK